LFHLRLNPARIFKEKCVCLILEKKSENKNSFVSAYNLLIKWTIISLEQFFVIAAKAYESDTS